MGIVRTVLLVEHEVELHAVMAKTLRGVGYDVVAAADGLAAEGLLARCDLDLVVTGLVLPGRSGFQVLRHAKERSDDRLPVIVTSTITAAAHRHYALALGADVFLARPFSPGQLAQAAESLCAPQPSKAVSRAAAPATTARP